jgi:hypothetical protein
MVRSNPELGLFDEKQGAIFSLAGGEISLTGWEQGARKKTPRHPRVLGEVSVSFDAT